MAPAWASTSSRPMRPRHQGIHGARRVSALSEQTIALLHWFGRLRIRWDIRDDIHEAFLKLACSLICWRRLQPHSVRSSKATGPAAKRSI